MGRGACTRAVPCSLFPRFRDLTNGALLPTIAATANELRCERPVLERKPFGDGSSQPPVALATRKFRVGAPAHYRRSLWLMLTPFLVGALLLIVLPAGAMLPLIFASYDGISPPRWVGWRNFALVGSNPLFWLAARNTALFVLLAVPLRLLGTLGLALLLSPERRGVGWYRVAVYLPTVVPDAAYALIWLWIVNPLYGPLNMVLGALGLPQPAWLAQPQTALLALVLMSLFAIGEGFVILLAALQELPADYYGAAAIDGASRWQRFRFITLPLLAPWLLLLGVRDVVFSAQNSFTPAYLMTGGGPYFATLFVPLLIYEQAFDRLRFGEATLMLLALVLLLGLLLWLAHRLLGGWGYEDEA